MNIAICDDNPDFIAEFEIYLENMNIDELDYNFFYCGEDLVALYENNQADFDAVFLDMEMDGINGIETANRIRKYDRHVIIVFVTNYTHYMQQSFECQPFRFIIKPLSQDEVNKVIELIRRKINDEQTTLVFYEKREMVRLYCEEIIYFESKSHYIIIHTRDHIYQKYKSITDLYDSLNKNMFYRIHNSYIINLNYVCRIMEHGVELYYCDRTLPVSHRDLY